MLSVLWLLILVGDCFLLIKFLRHDVKKQLFLHGIKKLVSHRANLQTWMISKKPRQIKKSNHPSLQVSAIWYNNSFYCWICICLYYLVPNIKKKPGVFFGAIYCKSGNPNFTLGHALGAAGSIEAILLKFIYAEQQKYKRRGIN